MGSLQKKVTGALASEVNLKNGPRGHLVCGRFLTANLWFASYYPLLREEYHTGFEGGDDVSFIAGYT